MDQQEWEKLSAAGKKRQLYIRQKQLLDMFFEKKDFKTALHPENR